MIKIQYCSDLHLEFDINNFYLKNNPIIPAAEILVLAGDISYLRKDFYKNPFFDYVAENWETVYWLPGNHEFYCGIDMLTYDFSKPISIRKNVFLLNNCTIEHNNIFLIFSTLWSRIDKKYAVYIEKNVSDFHAIVINNKKLSASAFNQLHKSSLTFLQNHCKHLKDKKKIIITHHLPSEQCNSDEFQGSALNSAFSTELSDFVKKCGADYWIYGHSHRNKADFNIGKTKMLTNQLGYVHLDEYKKYKKDAVIVI